ncbi:MAG: hypothetical protein IPJ93_04550 [Bacteroidota bacterium]|nr:MAG: hypothetical protein IPJ93_04550 [Bacteroidota bacterium]
MKKAIFITLTCVVALSTVRGQDMWGIANSNYAGNFAIDINPSSMAVSPIKYELNILSGNMTFYNNYLYLPKGKMSVGKFFKADYFNYDWQDQYTGKDKNAFFQTGIKGPSFFLRSGQTAFGLQTGLKAMGSVRNVDFEMAKLFYENSTYTPLQHTELEAGNNKLAALLYGEIGASFAQQIEAGPGNRIAIGATFNYLMVFDGFYAQNDHMQYRFDDESMLHVPDLQAEYGYAVPQDGKSDSLKVRGKGFSTTWGVQYIHGLNPEAYNVYASRLKFKKYKYKIGMSLVDAGSILFAKDTRTVKFDNNNIDWSGFDTTGVESISQLGELIRSKVFDDSTSGYVATKYRAKLPAAISIQFDYCLTHFLYLNTSIIQPVTSKSTAIRRPAQLSFTPRLETWRYEISFPLTWYEYDQVRLGTCLRLGQVVIGSDYLTSMLGLSKFNGFDFFVGIKHSSYAMDKLSKRKKEKVKDTYTGGDI